MQMDYPRQTPPAASTGAEEKREDTGHTTVNCMTAAILQKRYYTRGQKPFKSVVN